MGRGRDGRTVRIDINGGLAHATSPLLGWVVARDAEFLAKAHGTIDSSTTASGARPTDIDESDDGRPEPARVESWLRTLIGFEDARVVTVVALTTACRT